MSEFPKSEIETLWCPWRVEYFEKEPRNSNFLAEAATASDDAAHFVLTRRKTAFLMMNRYPYAVGHLMAVPYKKTAEMASLGENEIVDLLNLVAHGQTLLRAAATANGNGLFRQGMSHPGCLSSFAGGRVYWRNDLRRSLSAHELFRDRKCAVAGERGHTTGATIGAGALERF